MMLKAVTWVVQATVNDTTIPSMFMVVTVRTQYFDWDVSSLKVLKRYDQNSKKNQLICVLKIRY